MASIVCVIEFSGNPRLRRLDGDATEGATSIFHCPGSVSRMRLTRDSCRTFGQPHRSVHLSMSYKRRKNVGLTPRFARNLVQRERTGVLSDVYCNVGEVAVSDDSKTGLYRTPRAEQADRGDEGQDATAVNQEPNGGGTQANRDANQDQKIRDIESESQRRERATYRLAIAGVLIAAASVAVSTLQ